MAADASGIADAVAVAYKVLDETFRRFSRSQVTLSFNGGKDCTVVLHLLRQYFQDRAADGDVGEHPPGTLGGVRLVFFAAPNPFPEVTAFIDRVLELYGLKLETYDGFKSGLSALAADGIKAVMLGTRDTDPDGVGLDEFAPTSAGWPDMMRVNPILRWSYSTVWAYLRSTGLPYCSLYDDGYTSLGSTADTLPNPGLQHPDDPWTFLPAWELADGTSERDGRVKRSKKPPPATPAPFEATVPPTAAAGADAGAGAGAGAASAVASASATATTGATAGASATAATPVAAAAPPSDVDALLESLTMNGSGGGGGGNKKKNKKKKKKKGGAGASAPAETTDAAAADGAAAAAAVAPAVPSDPEEAFRMELRWCVAQLQRGLKRADKDQAKESRAVIRTLTSAKTPLVKRRATMRRVFGDYRSLMKTMVVPQDELDAIALPEGLL